MNAGSNSMAELNNGSTGKPFEAPTGSNKDLLRAELMSCFEEAKLIYESGDDSTLRARLGTDLYEEIRELAGLKHAAVGIALTLCLYKLGYPEQDIRLHKTEFPSGFSARTIDSEVTVPFLRANSFPYNVESHWLTQTFSMAGPYLPDTNILTSPKRAGPLMVRVVNAVEAALPDPRETAQDVVVAILVVFLEHRAKSKIDLTFPKNLTIVEAMDLLKAHLSGVYKSGTPRLPQLAIYALYRCLVPSVERYRDCILLPLQRMKAADRKSGTVGDVVVTLKDRPIEAVETKLGIPISAQLVAEAIQKIRSASVDRYFVLSTAGVDAGEVNDITKLQHDFRRSNGCEIVVNGVVETVAYGLRLLRSPTDFITEYVSCLEIDPDVNYQHKAEWNRLCADR